MTEETTATATAPESQASGPELIDANTYRATLEQNKTMQGQLEQLIGELDKFKQKHAEAEKHRKQQEQEARQKADEAARAAGDVSALEQSWNEKYNNLESSSVAEINKLNSIIQDVTVGAEAKALASALAIEGSADVLIPHIQSRLTMELVEGRPSIKVLQNGKPSALTIEDLKNELSENPAFKPIIRGISANGSGGIGGGQSGKNTMNRSQFDGLSHVEKSRFIREGGKVVD